MTDAKPSLIARVVAHNQGPVALSRVLTAKTGKATRPSYQQISKWVSRGWASPRYLDLLEPLLPEDVTRDDLAKECLAQLSGPPMPERRQGERRDGDRRSADRRTTDRRA